MQLSYTMYEKFCVPHTKMFPYYIGEILLTTLITDVLFEQFLIHTGLKKKTEKGL